MSTSPRPVKRRRRSSSSPPNHAGKEYGLAWRDWPAPATAMLTARAFIMDIVNHNRSVLIVPDKDADGLSAGTLLFKAFIHLGLPIANISVHHLQKGTNVHSDSERDRLISFSADRVIVLDQGSRPGRSIIPPGEDGTANVLIIDHHMSDEWPDGSLVLTACHTEPIATASLLTYLMLRELHPQIRATESWRAVIGVIGDLGTGTAKWGTAPWPAELGTVTKQLGAKSFSDAVAGVNAPRRTAEYNVSKAWNIYLGASSPANLASNAFLKLCRMDVNQKTEKWARTPPKFSADGRVAVVTIDTGFQVHPVIATRWAGTLGRKSPKLLMVMCANTGFNPDPLKVSFSCRISAALRSLPDDSRPNLIALLNEYANGIEGFKERVGGDFARGHKEATGGIIAKAEFALLLAQMGVGVKPENSPSKRKAIDSKQTTGIKDFFRVVPAQKEETKG